MKFCALGLLVGIIFAFLTPWITGRNMELSAFLSALMIAILGGAGYFLDKKKQK
ncbi:LPXTG cell wall anchor domain-containing protein [Corynebacterium sp. 3HC-13]|uniref:LPXTG cell wall anchor domain-containing protein n=1 Tax=Corynebacterium poyangense TaxID=2684405 RepID=UPI001CC9E936|nr:LPXTG cell wall anchor domain-containing protein [Corynebacterium poyangense]MBZ8176192.1 LPXTG cell wall anchor domain-containing protein [Corynebacterium poyangense]